ncbi:hypothetical protein KBB45_04560 [Myxococcota bacterium]|nr:hypothetical protein [Myxococcota bacterium]
MKYLVVAISLLLASCTCRKEPKMEPDEQPLAVVQQETVTTAVPGSTVAALEAMAPVLPSNLEAVGVFPASRITNLVKSLPETFPFLAFAVNAEDFTKRLSTIFGLNLTDLEGTCAFALVKDAGPLFVCPAGEITPVKGAYIWKSGDISGYNVKRHEVEVSFAKIGKHLVAGSVKAVHTATMVAQQSWPRLENARSRWLPNVSEAAGEDEYGHSALFFLEPKTAPWCDKNCQVVAIFADEKRVRAVTKTSDEAIGALEERFKGWWAEIDQRIRELEKSSPRPLRMTDAWLKPGLLLLESGELKIRGPVAFFKANGDPLVIFTILNLEDVAKVLTQYSEFPEFSNKSGE